MATVVVQKPASATVTVSEVNNSVVLTQPADSRIVEIASAGPAGPPFSGVHYFDLTQIAALGAADEGKVLNWNGSIFVPTDDLSANLTLNGGAF